jgi:hypothetical protein
MSATAMACLYGGFLAFCHIPPSITLFSVLLKKNIVLSLKYSRIKARIDPHNVEYKVFVNLAVETKWNFTYLMRQEVEMLDRTLDFT